MSYLSCFLNCKSEVVVKEPKTSVTFDDLHVIHTLRDGTQKTVLWSDLKEVSVVALDEGPLGGDVFFMLVDKSNGCLVPSKAEGAGELLERLQKLPHFKNEAIIRAMRSASHAKFLCWLSERGLSSQ